MVPLFVPSLIFLVPLEVPPRQVWKFAAQILTENHVSPSPPDCGKKLEHYYIKELCIHLGGHTMGLF